MESTTKPQLVDSVMLKAGFRRKSPRRLKAKHLSEVARREIIRLFMSYESHDDVAREMDMPGLTGRTVSEVLDVYQMRKPPASEARLASPFVMRRTA
jgi:hypothetical protein